MIENRDGRIRDDTFLSLPATTTGRMLPAVTEESKAFWDGFSEEKLLMPRCQSCHLLVHYPVDGCVWCGESELTLESVNPNGSIYSFTVCYLEFGTGVEAPYVVAHIELEIQPGLRLISNVINCRISDIHIGMEVEMVVVHGEQSLPFYQPTAPTLSSSSS